MATFYFNAAVDGDWQTLGNWWMAYDGETGTHSVPATALPTSADDIEVRGSISSNSGSAPTVANAAFFGWSYIEAVSITITGDCTFNDSSGNGGTITGDCTFNDSLGNQGIITGDCTFNSSANGYLGTITGDCTFNSSGNSGTITGDCTFNGDDSSGNGGTITGNCTFNGSSYNYATITGDCTFNDSSGNSGTITGDCTFNDSSGNGGTITGAARFVPSSAAVAIASNGTYGSVEVIYDKGINGSSILGVV